MKGFIASLTAETVSLRDPEGQLYHSCLPLPSFSTMVGIAGAAMGMDFKQALEFLRLTRSLSEPAVPITEVGEICGIIPK